MLDLGLEWVLMGVDVVSIAVTDLGLEWVLVGVGTLRTSVSGTFLQKDVVNQCL